MWRLILVVLALGSIYGTRVSAHDMYSDWKIPGSQASCCSGTDCHPTRAWQDMDGNWTALHKGMPRQIRKEIILSGRAPDGRCHLCASDNGQTYCFMPCDVRS